MTLMRADELISPSGDIRLNAYTKLGNGIRLYLDKGVQLNVWKLGNLCPFLGSNNVLNWTMEG